MAQFDDTLRNGILDYVETNIGTGPSLEIRSGQPPANCAASDSGTLIVSLPLPSDWMAAASSGAKALSGTWQANAAAARWECSRSASRAATSLWPRRPPGRGSSIQGCPAASAIPVA